MKSDRSSLAAANGSPPGRAAGPPPPSHSADRGAHSQPRAHILPDIAFASLTALPSFE